VTNRFQFIRSPLHTEKGARPHLRPHPFHL
jgi:hypothetical protein